MNVNITVHSGIIFNYKKDAQNQKVASNTTGTHLEGLCADDLRRKREAVHLVDGGSCGVYVAATRHYAHLLFHHPRLFPAPKVQESL